MIVQDEFLEIVPPVRVNVFVPESYATSPPHCGVTGETGTVNPAGNVSENCRPVRGTLPVFCNVNDKVDVPLPLCTGFGPNALVILTPGVLVSEASAGVVFEAPLAVVILPIGNVFVRLPFTFIPTLIVRVQTPLAGRLPPL